MTTTIKNGKQIKAEKLRLRLREQELKEIINSDWSEMTGDFRFGPELPAETQRVVASNEDSAHREEESILVSTLAYAGALLGRKLGLIVEEKIAGYFKQEE